jgi:long-subunit fatty acid transport protein
MGEAGVAIADDVNAASMNPAGLSQLKGQELALMHHAFVMDSAVEHLAYGLNLIEGLGVSVSLDYLNFGSVDKYTIDTTTKQLKSSGSFSPSGYHLDLGAGYAFGPLAAGLNVKMLGQTFDASGSSAFAADLGALWKNASGFSLGAALQDLGTTLDGSNLPMGVRAGGAYKLAVGDATDSVSLAADASVPSADSAATTIGTGLEYSAKGLYALRAGYKLTGNGGVGGLTLGAGLGYKLARIDYAFSSVGALGNSNQVSALLKF